jgi:predicted ATPase
MTVRMLLRQVKLENLLSFRNTTVELRGLNVLIGANASGKSNLIEAIGLLQAAPVDLNIGILRLGGVHVVCSLATSAPIACVQCDGLNGEPFSYRLEFGEQANGFSILKERLTAIPPAPPMMYFDRTPGKVVFGSESRGEVSPTESIFRVYKNPSDPTPITRLGRALERIRIYRDFRTTGDSQTRLGVSASTRKELLQDDGANLAVVLLDMNFRGVHERIRDYLRRFCDRFNDVKVNLDGPIAKTYVEESGLLEPLPSWRLSDGTLKFLCLLAVLLEPNPAPLICIEEPEVGLHPEAIQIVVEALVEASERTQLIVTTHSEALIDALSDRPEDVLVTERDFDNGTHLRRLDKKQLSLWLERYGLGQLWRKGEIGGNRW